MKVRDWQDVLRDVVETESAPQDWRAVVGNRASGLGEDFYVGHPSAGLFLLKTYAKNPYEVRGVGTQVARRIDDEIDAMLPTGDAGRFAIGRPPSDESDAERKARRLETVLQTHAEAPTTAADLFDDVMETLESPAYGPMDYRPRGRPEGLDRLSRTFEEAESILDAEFDDIVAADEVDRGFY